MSQHLRTFTQAVYAFDAVVQRTPADAWGAQTPCSEWNARQLVEHQCAVLNGVATIAQTGQMAGPTPSPESEDVIGTWNACRNNLLSSLDAQGVLAQRGPFWFGAANVDELVAAVAWDPATHSWDLATAVGVEHGLTDDLIQATMETVAPRIDMLSESGRTAPSLAVGADAPLLEQYLAMVGRPC